jgi:hypothetical protein
VRDVVRDLLDLAHQGLDAIEHQVEVLGDLIPFVARSAQRNPLPEAVMHDGAAGRVDGLDPSDRAPRDRNARHARQHQEQYEAPGERRPGLAGELVEVADILSDQQARAVGKRFEFGARDARRDLRLAVAHVDIPRSVGAGERGRPSFDIAGEPGQRRIGEEIHAAVETSVGDAPFDRGDQRVASAAVPRGQQQRTFRRDRAVRPVVRVGDGRPIDVGEQGEHDRAENADRDQRQLERGRSQRLSQEHGHNTRRLGPCG